MVQGLLRIPINNGTSKSSIFFCKCAEVCKLRMRYRDLFEGMFKTLRAFAPSSSEFIPFLTCHHSITDLKSMHS